MGWKVEKYLPHGSPEAVSVPQGVRAGGPTRLILAVQLAVTYSALLVTLWTPRAAQAPWILLTAVCVLLFTLTGPYTPRELGLRWGGARTAAAIILAAAMLAAAITFLGHLAGVAANFARWGSWKGPAGYFGWALVQQFLLQSFFFVRLESLFRAGRPAVLAAAILFTIAHIPNPVLTGVTFVAGLATCEAFRRWRGILPLATAHALVGLAIAVTLPDRLLHHMKVGLGYLHHG
jgi:membrane protease YdiL (CAAX protease family)